MDNSFFLPCFRTKHSIIHQLLLIRNMKTIEASPAKEFLRAVKEDFRKYKNLGDKTFLQLSDADFYETPYNDGNSLAILIQHISGNLISRFSDFLTSDGEKETRDRDSEFIPHNHTKAQLLQIWDSGYDVLFQTLDELSESDLSVIIYIRHEPLSVPEALIRSMGHISYHIGQIVFLAKFIKQHQWQTLSIEKGKSEVYNQEMIAKNENIDDE